MLLSILEDIIAEDGPDPLTVSRFGNVLRLEGFCPAVEGDVLFTLGYPRFADEVLGHRNLDVRVFESPSRPSDHVADFLRQIVLHAGTVGYRECTTALRASQERGLSARELDAACDCRSCLLINSSNAGPPARQQMPEPSPGARRRVVLPWPNFLAPQSGASPPLHAARTRPRTGRPGRS